jgi:2-keto-4-pentenoate hydratase/2-oxohepta-3-ene-1,7-dioic acid hydratase in catechol pathway
VHHAGRAVAALDIGDLVYAGYTACFAVWLTLEAGDIISTGTPAGVGFAMDPPRYLKGSDVVVSTIDRIGSLRNRIVEV